MMDIVKKLYLIESGHHIGLGPQWLKEVSKLAADEIKKQRCAMPQRGALPGDIVEIEVPARSSTSKDGMRYRGRLVAS